MDKRFDSIDKKFESMDKRFDSIDKKFESMDERFDSMDKKFESVDERFDSMDKKFESVDEQFDSIGERLGTIETMVENDISHNIKIIAEGHADLSRKLSDVIETERERELLNVRVNLLEADVKLLKAKVNV